MSRFPFLSPRPDFNDKEYDQVRNRVWAEANSKCQKPSCWKSLSREEGDIGDKGQIHHIENWREAKALDCYNGSPYHPDYHPDDLILLCPKHHREEADQRHHISPTEVFRWKGAFPTDYSAVQKVAEGTDLTFLPFTYVKASRKNAIKGAEKTARTPEGKQRYACSLRKIGRKYFDKAITYQSEITKDRRLETLWPLSFYELGYLRFQMSYEDPSFIPKATENMERSVEVAADLGRDADVIIARQGLWRLKGDRAGTYESRVEGLQEFVKETLPSSDTRRIRRWAVQTAFHKHELTILGGVDRSAVAEALRLLQDLRWEVYELRMPEVLIDLYYRVGLARLWLSYPRDKDMAQRAVDALEASLSLSDVHAKSQNMAKSYATLAVAWQQAGNHQKAIEVAQAGLDEGLDPLMENRHYLEGLENLRGELPNIRPMLASVFGDRFVA